MSITKINPKKRQSQKGNTATALPTILYVEDEDANWEVLRLNLANTYKLIRARNSKKAFSLLANSEFDLILMDIQLTGSDFNGIEIAQCLRGNRIEPEHFVATPKISNIPIIFVTAYPYTQEDVQDIGGNNVVHKPVDFRDLSLLIKLYLDPEYDPIPTPAQITQPEIKQDVATSEIPQLEPSTPELSAKPISPPLPKTKSQRTEPKPIPRLGKLSMVYKIFPILFIGSLLSLYWATEITQSQLVIAEKEKLRITTEAASTSLESFFQRAHFTAKTLARFPETFEVIETEDPKNFIPLADEIIETNSEYFATLVLNTEHTVVAANSTNARNINVSERVLGKKIPELKKALNWSLKETSPKERFIGWLRSALLGPPLEKSEQFLAFIVPILGALDQKPAGAIVLLISSEEIAKQFLSPQTIKRANKKIEEAIFLVTPRQRIWAMATTLDSETSFDTITKKLLALSRQKDSTARINVSLGDESFYGAVSYFTLTKLQEKKWAVLHLRSLNGLERVVSGLKKRISFGLSIIFLLTLFALITILKRSLAPLKDLATRTHGITKAQDFVPIPIQSTDEVGALAQFINEAFETLGDYEIGLEQKVELRTLQLEKTIKEFKAAQAQLIQSKKQSSLDEPVTETNGTDGN